MLVEAKKTNKELISDAKHSGISPSRVKDYITGRVEKTLENPVIQLKNAEIKVADLDRKHAALLNELEHLKQQKTELA